MFYVYYKSYADGYLFKLPRWDDDIKKALRHASPALEETNIKFVWQGEPMFMDCGIEDLEYYIEIVAQEKEWSKGDEFLIHSTYLDILTSLRIPDDDPFLERGLAEIVPN